MRRIAYVTALLIVFATMTWAIPLQQHSNGDQAVLRKEAKISMQEAEETARSKEPGTIKSKELERENGRVIYSFDIQTANGIREVNVDAVTGTVVEDSAEPSGAEAAERKEEKRDQKNTPEPKGRSAHRVPVALANTGEYAENIYDAAQGANWTEAKQKLSALQSAVGSLPSTVTATQKQQIESSLQKLDQSISAENRIATLKEANRITRLAAEASAKFRSTPPVQVSMLDYYGRELQIGAETNDSAELHRTATDMQRTWNEIRPQVERLSSSEASRFNELVSKIASAQSSSQYAQLAKAELDQVDALEKVFEAAKAHR